MHSFFPASYSTLSPEALAALISEEYGFTDTRCKLILRGVGDTYLVETKDDRYILRVYRASHRNRAQIEDETNLLLALKAAQVPVSYPISDLTGKVIQSLHALEGERQAVLFSYAPGQSVLVLNEKQLTVLGNQMARFHNVSSQIKPNGSRWEFNTETTLHQPLRILKTAFAEDPEGYAWLLQTVEKIENKLAELNTAAFSTGYCHFDFVPKNFHFEGDSITFFDFDFLGHGWLVNDIMTFWTQLWLDVLMGRSTQEEVEKSYSIFLDGYRAFRPLSDDEIKAVPYLGLGFWLFYSAFSTTHDTFYHFVEPNHIKQRYAMVRKGIEKHLV